MLILTRSVGATIRIGEEVKVTVVQVKVKRVRLGFDMPKGVEVRRREILTRGQDEAREPAYPTSPPPV